MTDHTTAAQAAMHEAVLTDQRINELWIAQRQYHGGEPTRLSHLEFARAIERELSKLRAPVAREAQRSVATLRVTHKGYAMELSTYVAYALPEGTHDLYAAPQASEAVRVQQLEAARIAYAREFPPDENGDPDVRNIHANIRKLKSQVAALSAQPGAQKKGGSDAN